MAIELKHATQATGTDAGNGEIRKAEWNENHALTMATARVLGRTTADAGAVEELSAGTGIVLAGGTVAADVATDANIQAGTANKLVAAAGIYSASAVVTLTDGTTVTPDLNAGRNFVLTLGGNRTLANPTNQAAGQSGLVIVKQDGTGSRTLSYGGNWKFPGGAPTLTTAANAVDAISYYVEASGTIRATFAGDLK
jgi:hypothetical protein